MGEGNVSAHDVGRIDKVIKKASSIVGKQLDSFTSFHNKRVLSKANIIECDSTHPLYDEFAGRRSRVTGRFLLPVIRTERYRRSFIPHSIRQMNQAHGRQEGDDDC